MLWSLQGRASDRKLRLFVVACCYLINPPASAPRPIFEAVERFADDPAALGDVRQHWPQGVDDPDPPWPERPWEWATGFAAQCWKGEAEALDEVRGGYPPALALPPILREVFGNPF